MSNKSPFISVVIPAYNEEKYLPRCLQALSQQTYPRELYEIIVANNNSTDKTAEIAVKFGARVVNAAEQGYVHAVDKGYSAAKGEIIACTDADSQASSTWLEQIADYFVQHPKTVAITGSVESDFEPIPLRAVIDRFYRYLLHFSFAIGNPNLGGYNMAFRKDAFVKAGGVNKSFAIGADTELGKRLHKHGSVKLVPHIQVKTSARRWRNNFFKTLWKYSRAYVYTHYLKRGVSENLQVYR